MTEHRQTPKQIAQPAPFVVVETAAPPAGAGTRWCVHHGYHGTPLASFGTREEAEADAARRNAQQENGGAR